MFFPEVSTENETSTLTYRAASQARMCMPVLVICTLQRLEWPHSRQMRSTMDMARAAHLSSHEALVIDALLGGQQLVAIADTDTCRPGCIRSALPCSCQVAVFQAIECCHALLWLRTAHAGAVRASASAWKGSWLLSAAEKPRAICVTTAVLTDCRA